MPVAAAWAPIRVAEDERPPAVSVSDAISVSWAEMARVRPEPEEAEAEAEAERPPAQAALADEEAAATT